MYKIGKIALSVLFATAAATSLYAHEKIGATEPIVCSKVEGKEWVQKCIDSHPEILWLADQNVRSTQEGNASLQGAYSEQFFGTKYLEFDRTLMTLRSLKLILEGTESAYELFTAAQPKEAKLSYESFRTLHNQGKELLESGWHGLSKEEMAQAMETALILGDIGKGEKAREIFKPFGAAAPDHDDFYGEAMEIMNQHPDLSPSFKRLPSAAKELLVKIANSAHYGHITHLEGGIGMLKKLKESSLASNDPVALSFDLFVHTCDVAGAAGHVNKESSLVYTEPTHRSMQAMEQAVRVLADPEKSELDAYDAYLKERASWLKLNPEERSDRVVARISAMLRVSSPEEGLLLKKGMLEIEPSIREKIITQLDAQELSKESRTPTYMPAVLVNLANNKELGATKEERLVRAVTLGLPFLAKVLEKHQALLEEGKINPQHPLNFNEMAGVAKNSPDSLRGEFCIDGEGNIHLASPVDR